MLYGCCSSHRYDVSMFKIPRLAKDESEYTAAIKTKARQEWINVIVHNRPLTPELKERIEKSKVYFCELHFKADCILESKFGFFRSFHLSVLFFPSCTEKGGGFPEGIARQFSREYTVDL